MNSTPLPTGQPGIFRCPACGLQNRQPTKTPFFHQCPESQEPPAMPPLRRQAWNLVQSLADFVADGCQTVTQDVYEQRMEICDGCEFRHRNRCAKCGCGLSLKARGRAFKCPIGKW